LRAAGARIREVGFSYATFAYELEEALDGGTAAVFWLAGIHDGSLPLPAVTRIAHAHGIPVIVDASPQLPPRENLRRFLSEGADLVAFSGGKHIRGPQASGILCGRQDLILSAALQHQDMDVFPETWPSRELIAAGRIAGPPHHGIGRGFKAGKEEIMGLMTALERYLERDNDAEIRAWRATLDRIAGGARSIPGLTPRVVMRESRPVPVVHITVNPQEYGSDAQETVNRLGEGDPMVCVFEGPARDGILAIHPESLQPGDAEAIVRRLAAIGGR
jgi:L-seryl-tRNA(Ser) seleniumtransferase